MTGAEMVRLYKSEGWVIDRIHGSHYVMKKNEQIEIIPNHGGRDLAKGLENKLLKRLGL